MVVEATKEVDSMRATNGLAATITALGPTATSKPVPPPTKPQRGSALAFARDFGLHVASLEIFAAFIGSHANQLCLLTPNNPGKLQAFKGKNHQYNSYTSRTISNPNPLSNRKYTSHVPPLDDLCGAVVTDWDEKKRCTEIT